MDEIKEEIKIKVKKDKPVIFKKGKEQASTLFVNLKGRDSTTIIRSEKGIFTLYEKTPIAYMRKLGYEEIKN